MKKLLFTLLISSLIPVSVISQFILYDNSAPFGYHVAFPGSGPLGAPNNSDGALGFLVTGTGCSIIADATVSSLNVYNGGAITITSPNTLIINGSVSINLGGTITINNGASLVINSSITNDGVVSVNSGGNLIQLGSGSASGSGYNILTNGQSNVNNYNLWSSPINQPTIATAFSGANQCDIYYYNATAQAWQRDISISTCVPVVTASGDGNMENGVGLLVAGGGSVTFSGAINTGDITSVNVTQNGVVQPGWSGTDWNLVGNPYPSSISASTFLSVNSGKLNGTVYFWDDDGSAGGSYDGGVDFATWNLAGGSGSSSSGGSGAVPNGSIAVGQGFFVQAHSSGPISYTNAMRGGSNSQFFKSDDQQVERIWLNATSPTNQVNQILMAFSDSATDGVDWGYDSKMLGSNSDFVFGSIIENDADPFVIQTFEKPISEINKEVSLSLFTAQGGVTSIEIFNTENLDSNIVVYLKDYQTGKVQNLTTGPFAVYLNANQNYDSRFSLIFANESGPSPTNIANVDEAYMSIYHYENTIYLNSKNEGLKSIRITNMNGTVVNSELLNGTNETQMDVSYLKSGMYIAKVTTINNRTKYTKFIMK